MKIIKKQNKNRKETRFERNKDAYNDSLISTDQINLNKKVFIILIISLTFNMFFYFSNSLEQPKTVNAKDMVVKVPNNYLFLGDSITYYYNLEKYFPDMPVVNSGISSNTTEDILEDMKNRVYDFNPSKVFLLIGTNDLRDKKSVDEVVTNIKEIIKEIKKNRKDAKLYIESIYPVNEKVNEKGVEGRKNEDIKEINRQLKKYAKENNITFINIYDKLVDDEGLLNADYTTDGLNINENGYEVITKELKKYLN